MQMQFFKRCVMSFDDINDDDLWEDTRTPEEIILADVEEWCEVHLLDGETWAEYLGQFPTEKSVKEMRKMMDIYWKDHIFPIDKY
jgi:hypothetical protein